MGVGIKAEAADAVELRSNLDPNSHLVMPAQAPPATKAPTTALDTAPPLQG